MANVDTEEIQRGDLPRDTGVAPSRTSKDLSENDTESDKPDDSGSQAHRASRGPPNKKAKTSSQEPWATREDRLCDTECSHDGVNCFFPGIKDGKEYAVPFIHREGEDLTILDKLGNPIPTNIRGNIGRIKEGVILHGCSLEFLKLLEGRKPGYYKLLASLVHHGPAGTPEHWRSVRANESLSIQFGPSKADHCSRLGEEWRGAVGIVKQLFQRVHEKPTESTSPPEDRARQSDHEAAEASQPAEETGNASPIPSTPIATLPPNSVDDSRLTSARQKIEKKLEARVAREIAEATAQLREQLGNVEEELGTQKSVCESLQAQLEARQTQNGGLENNITALGKLLKSTQEEADTWKKRKSKLDLKVKSMSEELAVAKQSSAAAAKEAFDKGFTAGSDETISLV